MPNDAADDMPPLLATATASQPLAVAASEAARLCGVSRALWWRLHASGRCPLPIHINRRTLWLVEGPSGLRAWLEAGCPSRDVFATMKAVRR